MGTFSDTEFFLVTTLVKIVLVFLILLTSIAYLTWLERKLVAHIQSPAAPDFPSATGQCWWTRSR